MAAHIKNPEQRWHYVCAGVTHLVKCPPQIELQ